MGEKERANYWCGGRTGAVDLFDDRIAGGQTSVDGGEEVERNRRVLIVNIKRIDLAAHDGDLTRRG